MTARTDPVGEAYRDDRPDGTERLPFGVYPDGRGGLVVTLCMDPDGPDAPRGALMQAQLAVDDHPAFDGLDEPVQEAGHVECVPGEGGRVVGVEVTHD